VAQTYVTVLFDDVAKARDAKRVLEALPGVHVRRAFLVSRDARGMHVDGRYHGELPKIDIDHPFALLRTMLARLILGSSREEDGIAVEDAEEELAVGQAAVVALVDEHDATAIDRTMRECGGAVTRSATGTLTSGTTDIPGLSLRSGSCPCSRRILTGMR
jgi:hypothetical protein